MTASNLTNCTSVLRIACRTACSAATLLHGTTILGMLLKPALDYFGYCLEFHPLAETMKRVSGVQLVENDTFDLIDGNLILTADLYESGRFTYPVYSQYPSLVWMTSGHRADPPSSESVGFLLKPFRADTWFSLLGIHAAVGLLNLWIRRAKPSLQLAFPEFLLELLVGIICGLYSANLKALTLSPENRFRGMPQTPGEIADWIEQGRLNWF